MEMDKLSGKEKAMVFLSALGDDASARVLECLPDNISKKISEELNFFPKPSKEMVAHVFKELNKLSLKASPEEEQKIAQTIEDQLTKKQKLEKPELPADPLIKIDAGELLHRLQNEQVQTIAFVLKLLTKAKQEKFYQLLSPGRRKEIADLSVADFPLKEKITEQLKQALLA
ncbi:MAG: hypothetical protein KKA19_01085 [Candidatus Margulisbacteria bacterium]|nr:hypothetical protein [Candidatus Margulisiibacteriota bacterium]